MEILVLHTGGTIASSYSENQIALNGNKAEGLAKSFETDEVHFTERCIMNVFSENIGLSHWNMMIDSINSALDENKFDGIIITHGSDTLSFTSAIISVIFSKAGIPITITAADHPVENEKSNALLNFGGCVQLIKSRKKGVFTVWKNSGEEIFIYASSDICEADPARDRFTSFSGNIVGAVKENKILFNESYRPSDTASDLKLLGKVVLRDSVLLIKCYPSMDFRCFDMTNFKAAVVYLYHSATAPTEGEGSVVGFLKEMKKKGKNVYLASFKDISVNYSTTNEMLSSGGIPLFNFSREMAFAYALIKENTYLTCG